MIRKTMLAGAGALSVFIAAPALAGHHKEAGAAKELSAPKIEYTRWVLGNGLTVIAIPDSSTANVTTSLWYEVGSKHDPDGRSGFAHLFEHILSRKTENMPYNMINRLTEDVGGVRNASTGADRTNYYETVPAEYLETMLWTHRERMALPVVDNEVFENERSVVKEELRQRVLAPPYGRLQRFVIPENAFDELPLRRPGIGSIEDLDSATLDDARAFHQAFYGPDTATLIVAGNFEIGRLRALVDQYFGDIPRRANPVSLEVKGKEPKRTSPRAVVATAPNVPLPVVGGIWKAPSVTHRDAAAIEVLSAIMSRGDNSRLHSALVRQGKAVQAVQFDALSEDGGYIVNFAVLGPTADAAEVRKILAAEVRRVQSKKVSSAELREAKNEIFASALYDRQTAQGRAFELGEALVSTGNPDAADERLAAIAAVTAKDVRRAARAWLRPRGTTVLTYVAGEDNPAAYANPVPMPRFGTVPPPTGSPRAVLPEDQRMTPPAPANAPEVHRAQFVESRLANGIPMVTAQTGDVPIATITIAFPGGSSADPKGKAGMAILASNLADKGTPTRSAEEIAATLESLGADINFDVSADGTFVSLNAPTIYLAEAGEVMADIVRNANFPAEETELERKRMLDSFAPAFNDPGSLAQLVAARVFYEDAPYGQIANPVSVPTITRDDMIRQRKAWWHPGVAKIVISGGLGNEEAHVLAEGLFGNWSSDLPNPTAVASPAGSEPPTRTLVIDMPDAGQAAVVAGTRTLARNDADFYNLWLANTVLGSGSNGWLFEEVRTKRALSYGAYSLLSQRADTATLTAQAQTKNDTADEVAAVFFDQFEKLAAAPLDKDALQKRRLFLGGALARSLETSGGFNDQVASMLLRGMEPGEAFRIAERLATVTPAEVQRVAQRYLSPQHASLVIVGDAQYFLDDLKAMRGDVEVIPFSELDFSRVDLRLETAEEAAAE